MKQKTGMALFLSVVLALTGCGSTAVLPQKNKEGVTDAPTQTEQTEPSTSPAVSVQDLIKGKYASRYYVKGAYLQLNDKVKLPAQVRCTIPSQGNDLHEISVITASVSKKENKLADEGKIMPAKYFLKKDVVYCIRKHAFLYDIKAPKAGMFSILEDTILSDANQYNFPMGIDEYWEQTIPEYDSWFRGCKKVKKIVVKKADQTRKNKLDEKYKERSGLYTQGDMLFYTKPRRGLYTVLMDREGSVSVPSDLKEIYSCAFQKCRKITDIYIPASVKHIGKAAFGYNAKLKKIDVSEENRNYKSVEGVVYSKDGKELIAYPAGKKDSSYRVPEGVEKIADGAFMGAAHLKKIILPDSLRYVGHKAFMDCSELSEMRNKKAIKRFKRTALINCDKIIVWPKRGSTF